MVSTKNKVVDNLDLITYYFLSFLKDYWSCPDGYSMLQESCYQLFSYEMTHLEAELFCTSNESGIMSNETTPLHVNIVNSIISL